MKRALKSSATVETGIPHISILRLPLYLRALIQLRERGQAQTSSHELAKLLQISAALIRKDLSYFGEFGIEKLQEILHLRSAWAMALVGAGDLGHALVRYNGFRPRGFYVAAVFDNSPAKVGTVIGDIVVQDAIRIPEVVRAKALQLGIIAVPTMAAQAVANALIKGGISAILNYAPIRLALPERIQVHDIDPVIGLQAMAYYLTPKL
jgi:redox-sensing transcriptional repressor